MKVGSGGQASTLRYLHLQQLVVIPKTRIGLTLLSFLKMLNNSLPEFAFHQAVLTEYVIQAVLTEYVILSGQRPRAKHGEELESVSHQVQ